MITPKPCPKCGTKRIGAKRVADRIQMKCDYCGYKVNSAAGSLTNAIDKWNAICNAEREVQYD